jgi:gliding motility-associated-like protein
MKKIILCFLLLIFYTISMGQQLVYGDIVYGGVTGNGAGKGAGSGTVNFSTQIPPNSTIKKAFIAVARDSLADDITIVLNGTNYTFSDSTIITNGFNAFKQGPISRKNSSMHMIDITTDIDSSINSYVLTVPPQFNSFKGIYRVFYLYIVFENITYAKINVNLFLNTQNVAPITNYNLTGITPIDNNKPVGLGLLSTDFCDTVQDGSYIDVNGNTIGLIGGEDLNSNISTCLGTWSNFAHYNDSLFGLDDDTPDSLMAATDALADIKSYINNGDTVINVTFIYQSNLGPLSNPIRTVMLSYTTPCDTFTTSITANDTICFGDSIQLNATGGSQYSWFGAFGGLSDTSIANPKASPSQTTTYIVTITNDSGCVKTEQVKIWVNPLPMPDTLIVINNFCGDSVGSLTVGNIPNGNPPYNYTLTNLQTNSSEFQVSSLFDSLVSGNYQIQIINNNGCVWENTVTITEVNNVVANFTANPQSGVAPLLVDFTNTSLNANLFEWSVINSQGDTLTQNTTLNTQYLFDSSGTYQVCLVVYNNIPVCADTICKTIIVEEFEDTTITLIIPNVFTPNADGNNDNFVIQLTGTSLIKNLKAEVFNRWGQLVANSEFQVQGLKSKIVSSLAMTELTLWDGYTTAAEKVPEGTYFYVISYETIDGEIESKKGSVTLLR